MVRTKIPTAQEMMRHKPFTLRPDDEIETAVRRLLKKGHSGAPVVDSEGRLRGVFSEHDCIRVMTDSLSEGWPAGHVEQQMSTDVETVDVSEDAFAISTRFTQGRHRRVLVIDDGRLVGLISRRDLMKALQAMEKAIDRASGKTTYQLIDERHRALD